MIRISFGGKLIIIGIQELKMGHLKLLTIMSILSFGLLMIDASSFMSYGWIMCVVTGCALAGAALVLNNEK